MASICGIINLDGGIISGESLKSLSNSVMWEGCIENSLICGNVAFAIFNHSQREPAGALLQKEELFFAGDLTIYNREYLRGFFDFETDAEAFLGAWRRWGADCANHINGDFAVVIYDRSQNRAWLFRDHAGVRPLAWCKNGSRVIFASSEFGIAGSGLATISFNHSKFIKRVLYNGASYESSILSGIEKALPGHYIIISRKRSGKVEVSKVRYWLPAKIKYNREHTLESAAKELRDLIISAIIRRDGNGSTGVHISGGLDSSAIAAILAQSYKRADGLIGYTWTPESFIVENPKVDERVYLDAVIEALHIPIHYVNMSEREQLDDSLIAEFENMSLEHTVMKMAAKHNVERIFSGWGGDEFVSISNRGVFNYFFFNFKWLKITKILLRFGPKHFFKMFRTEVLPMLIPFGLLDSYKGFSWNSLSYLKLSVIISRFQSLFPGRKSRIFGYGDRRRFMLNLLDNGHLAERMESWALFSQKYGFDYKYPLLDKDLLEFWFSLPAELTYSHKDSRYLFRVAMEGILPKKIRARNDKGESFRINYSKYNIVSNSSYLCEVVESIPNDGTLKYFRKELLLKRLKETSDPDKLFRYCRDATIFLRHYNISKEYPKLHDRGYLHKRHRLSHRQIDSLLCKESGKSFLEEKLNSLMLVSEFISIVRILNSKSIFFISLKGPLLSQRIYSDATVRISHDIDLFIKKEDFDAVYELMLSNGYRLCSGEVWPEGRSGRRMILKSAYHLAFCKEGSKFMIEIHWQLIDYIHISRKKLSHIIEENVMELSFNGESVRCFSPEFELVYIMIHGSKHGWSRLKWIMDIKDYPTESLNIQKFTELLSLMKAQRVLTQTNFIMNRFFNTKLPIKESCKINSYLLNYPIGCINSVIPERYSVKDILKKFIYNFLLFPGIIYRIRLITSLILRSSDAENIDSNHLIFYYLYRPWSFIKRRIIND